MSNHAYRFPPAFHPSGFERPTMRFAISLVLLSLCAGQILADEKPKAADATKASADPAARIHAPKGFKVDLLYSVQPRQKDRGST